VERPLHNSLRDLMVSTSTYLLGAYVIISNNL
jgi:hypothetical protein